MPGPAKPCSESVGMEFKSLREPRRPRSIWLQFLPLTAIYVAHNLLYVI